MVRGPPPPTHQGAAPTDAFRAPRGWAGRPSALMPKVGPWPYGTAAPGDVPRPWPGWERGRGRSSVPPSMSRVPALASPLTARSVPPCRAGRLWGDRGGPRWRLRADDENGEGVRRHRPRVARTGRDPATPGGGVAGSSGSGQSVGGLLPGSRRSRQQLGERHVEHSGDPAQPEHADVAAASLLDQGRKLREIPAASATWSWVNSCISRCRRIRLPTTRRNVASSGLTAHRPAGHRGARRARTRSADTS